MPIGAKITRTHMLAAAVAVAAIGGYVYHQQKHKRVYNNRHIPTRTNNHNNSHATNIPLRRRPSTDDFITTIFSSQLTLPKPALELPELPELPSIEEMNETMARLYPSFVAQFDTIRESYSHFWEYLTMEDFRKMVEQVQTEAKDSSLYPEVDQDAFVRKGKGLSKEEKTFLQSRKHFQRVKFAEFIGVDPNLVHEEDIPMVGIASSGGGYRAMIGSSGYLKAMKETGVLDCVTYLAGKKKRMMMVQSPNLLTQLSFDVLSDHFKDHVHTHIANVSNFLTILTASSHNTKILLQGVIQRYFQQNGSLNLVDIFGVLLGGALLTSSESSMRKEGSSTKETAVKPRLLESSELKLSNQRNYIEDGSQPMPIYCVVQHEIEDRDDNGIEKKDVYRWFEFTPYDMGSEEIEAWIPIWAFGREFEGGKNAERLPEQSIGILMGMFGSAFAASLAHFYQEIRAFLPAAALTKMDETLMKYRQSMSTIHPISPACYPNPFYKMSHQEDSRLGKLTESKDLCLMDAGMDNNIPFYPLLRHGRDVDVIIAIDLSADIQTAPHFERAEGYAKQRGIHGWPVGAGWPKSDMDERAGPESEDSYDGTKRMSEKTKEAKENPYPLGPCNIFTSSTTETTATGSGKERETTYPERINPITIIYFPLIGNDSYDPDFDPQTAEFCSTWNFVYTADQVSKLSGLAERNMRDNVDQIKSVLRTVWERKRRHRKQ
ncbi:hypothetical protein EC973_001231 [Apophysomyces ossiformis]|uniref:Lysophospholipase n=1 Tax=Apophysomyces ossiformis TaxID=679940 RepID=A0A8H7BI59_9FUNG|nr:hypothetical protein EC973_001231 [Apophysomyces ossiformis]